MFLTFPDETLNRMKNKNAVELNNTTINAMRQCILLQPLNDDDFEQIVQTSKLCNLTENERLFEQGEQLTAIYLLLSGGIKLQRLAPNGEEKVFEIIRPGQTFAEAVLFSGRSRFPVSAVALAASVVISIDAKNYLKLVETSNELSLNLLAKLSQRLHWMVNEVDRLTLHNATFRLVDYLLSHLTQDGNESTGISLIAPKHVIASRLSIKPETLSRTFKDLSKRGLIILHGSEVELVDIEQLRALISLES